MAALIVLSGCAGYQLSSQKKNVVVDKIAPDTFTVTFCGNAYMSQEEVEKYAQQRAAETALSKGFPYFVVLKKDDTSQICLFDSYKKKAQPYDAGGMPESPEVVPVKFVKPNVTLTIQCFSSAENLPEKAIDAQKFLDENFPGLTG